MDVHSRDQLRFHFSFFHSLPSIAQPFQFLSCVLPPVNAHIKEHLDKMTTNEVACIFERAPPAGTRPSALLLATGYNAKSSGTLRTI